MTELSAQSNLFVAERLQLDRVGRALRMDARIPEWAGSTVHVTHSGNERDVRAAVTHENSATSPHSSIRSGSSAS